jgi:N-carbamoylputrescine amidase
MSRTLTVAALQTTHDWSRQATVERVLSLAHEAADRGAKFILPSELFETPYFCKTANSSYRDLALPAAGHPTIRLFQTLAKERQAVVPVSFYERADEALYNSLAVIDADGELLGVYRKCHIPQFPGYRENAFFAPSPDGPKVWRTRHLKLGTGICWDQWFPELSRMMALMGAEMLVYPTAIGSEPDDPARDSRDQWQAVMRGHAAANLVPVLAANRTGQEVDDGVKITFYGSSFLCDHHATMIAVAPREGDVALLGTIDLDLAAEARNSWGTFQTRRPELYGPLAQVPAGPPPA